MQMHLFKFSTTPPHNAHKHTHTFLSSIKLHGNHCSHGRADSWDKFGFLFPLTKTKFWTRSSAYGVFMATPSRRLCAFAGLDWPDCINWWQTASNHQSRLSGRWKLVSVSRSMAYMSHPGKRISPLSCSRRSLGLQPVFKKTDYVACSRVRREPSISTSACAATTQTPSALLPPLSLYIL